MTSIFSRWVSGAKAACSVPGSPVGWRMRVGFIRLSRTEAGHQSDGHGMPTPHNWEVVFTRVLSSSHYSRIRYLGFS